MKIFAVVALSILLTGCITTPVQQEFPDIPPSLEEPCAELILTEPTQKLSQVLTVVAENYSLYHECQARVDAWQSWYQQQKKIFGSVD